LQDYDPSITQGTFAKFEKITWWLVRWTAAGNNMSPGTTVGFSVVIDRKSVSTGIVREIRDGWRTINGTALVTDERIDLSLCPRKLLVRTYWYKNRPGYKN
jgi:hypothetical protein